MASCLRRPLNQAWNCLVALFPDIYKTLLSLTAQFQQPEPLMICFSMRRSRRLKMATLHLYLPQSLYTACVCDTKKYPEGNLFSTCFEFCILHLCFLVHRINLSLIKKKFLSVIFDKQYLLYIIQEIICKIYFFWIWSQTSYYHQIPQPDPCMLTLCNATCQPAVFVMFIDILKR